MKRIIDSVNYNLIGGMSQKQLSEKMELLAVYTCRGSLSRIENGRRAVTDIEIEAICKILNITPNDLFGFK